MQCRRQRLFLCLCFFVVVVRSTSFAAFDRICQIDSNSVKLTPEYATVFGCYHLIQLHRCMICASAMQPCMCLSRSVSVLFYFSFSPPIRNAFIASVCMQTTAIFCTVSGVYDDQVVKIITRSYRVISNNSQLL